MTAKLSDITIKITGPGLVVNGPAITLLKALRATGFQVECEDWLGLDQWLEWSNFTEENMLKFIKEKAPCITVKVNVDPLPWGG